MKLLIIALLALSARMGAGSKCTSITVPSLLSTVSLPPTVEAVLAQALSYAGDVLQIGSIVSVIELTSPTLRTAESVIASYELSYSSLISYIEDVYITPSILPPSSVSSFSQLTSIHSTLASAIQTIVSIEEERTSFASVQNTLQYIDQSQPSILSYLLQYTEIASPTLYADTLVVEAATLTSPSILPSFIAVYTAVSDYEAVKSALQVLSEDLYTIPKSIDQLIISYINSPDMVSVSVRDRLSSCYPDVYAELSTITEFTKSHTTILTAITDYLSVAETVSSVGSALYEVMTMLLPTLTYQIQVMSRVEYSWPSVYTEMKFLSALTATSPTLFHALTTIEETFYSDPSVASNIYRAMNDPSTVTSPTKIRYDKIEHQSLVNAIEELFSFESAMPMYSDTMCYIMSELTKAFVTERTLLTAAGYLSDIISPNSYSASRRIESLFSVVSDLTTIMDELTQVVYYDTTLLCYEQTIESNVWYYPEYASYLWVVYNSPSEITSRFSYYSSLAADYSSLAYAFYKVVSAEGSYSLLDSAEESFMVAAESDSSVLTDFQEFTSQESSLLGQVHSVTDYLSSSS